MNMLGKREMGHLLRRKYQKLAETTRDSVQEVKIKKIRFYSTVDELVKSFSYMSVKVLSHPRHGIQV